MNNFELNWSNWEPLENIGRNHNIPAERGLYRVRVRDAKSLSYIGETGSSLRERLGQLSNGIYKNYMPYRDPHTAGPAFWSLLQLDPVDLEASVSPSLNLSKPQRKGLECLAIYEHRKNFNKSPTFNFGRMPLGYRMSSSNNKRLTDAGKRFRGGPINELLECHELGMSPFEEVESSEVFDSHILKMSWSKWKKVENLSSLSGSEYGLYILKDINKFNFLYVGEGKIKDRITTHLKKGFKEEHSQYEFFKNTKDITFSFFIDNRLKKFQRLEFETDLIGCHLKKFQSIPEAQFLG